VKEIAAPRLNPGDRGTRGGEFPYPTSELRDRPFDAARSLLGSLLVSTVDGATTVGMIVETEAYLGSADPASHAAERIGRTARNESMFGPPRNAYVYRIYGIHRCFNVVCGPEGVPVAVLVRALRPIDGLETMASRRGRPEELCSGPARLCQALGIGMPHDGHPLDRPPIRLLRGHPVPSAKVGVSGRIGLSRASHWPLRFFVRGDPHVSRARAPRPRRSAAFLRARAALEPE
jgi:DNA-3-methyladenine glycosylase